jgi:hypothetical protein
MSIMSDLIEKREMWHATDREARQRHHFLVLCLDATIVFSVGCLSYMYHDQILSFIEGFIH